MRSFNWMNSMLMSNFLKAVSMEIQLKTSSMLFLCFFFILKLFFLKHDYIFGRERAYFI